MERNMPPAHNGSPPIYVLIHGAYHGGWCWRETAAILRASGAQVHCPTLSGLAERRHLLPCVTGLETFVQDVCNLLFYEDLGNVVLVGHSFGARVALAVADRVPQRLSRIVLLDGGISIHGESRLDAMPPEQRHARLSQAMAHDGGLSIPAPSPEAFGVHDPQQQAWMSDRLTPQPLKAELHGVKLSNAPGNGLHTTYIRCIAPPFPGVDASAQYAQSRQDWHYLELAAGHDAMISHPQRLAEALIQP